MNKLHLLSVALVCLSISLYSNQYKMDLIEETLVQGNQDSGDLVYNRYFWDYSHESPLLIANIVETPEGKTKSFNHFFYDQNQLLIEERNYHLLPDSSFIVDKDNLNTTALPFDAVYYEYSSQNDSLIVFTYIKKREDLVQSFTIFNHPESFESISEKTPPEQGWVNSRLTTLWSGINSLYFTLVEMYESQRKELTTDQPLLDAVNLSTRYFFGDVTRLLFGFDEEDAIMGELGHPEMSQKVRITFINGILTTKGSNLYNLEMISESHGGVNVHYIMRPTRGWTNDLTSGVFLKIGFLFGYQSECSILLAEQWRALIHEMGGVNSGGVIVHYAHSLGGMETDRARYLLTPEEQKMIRVITFASAQLIADYGFQKVHNHVSVNDIVVFIVEPFKNFFYPFNPSPHIHYHGRWYGAIWEHIISSEIYSSLLFDLGKEFIKEFSP